MEMTSTSSASASAASERRRVLLTGFRMESCGYAPEGASAGRRSTRKIQRDVPELIETCEDADLDALGAVQWQVQENRARAGMRAMERTAFRYLRRHAWNLTARGRWWRGWVWCE
ncbi:hypothetical protein PG997_001612 [Apiospora hydei]|uniref:Transposase n=1 Tax=Apiospora hydei TaxID=1337664 RepID=A0ABR1XE79_9PEZI